MKFACDIDGVACCFVDVFARSAQRFGIEVDFTKYNHGLPPEDFLRVYEWMVQQGKPIYEMRPYRDSWQTLWDWHENWVEIHYLTRRGGMFDPELRKKHEAQTKSWLMVNFFPQHWNLHFVQEKDVWCLSNGIHILVEDRLEDAKRWLSNDLRVYLLDRLWNQGDYPLRIHSLREVNLE